MAKLAAIKPTTKQLGELDLSAAVGLVLKHTDAPIIMGPCGLYGDGLDTCGMLIISSDGAGDMTSMLLKLTHNYDESQILRRTFMMLLVERREGGIAIHDCATEENMMAIGVAVYPTEKMRALRMKLFH